MSIYITVFDILDLGYIIIKSLRSLVKAAYIKLLYSSSFRITLA